MKTKIKTVLGLNNEWILFTLRKLMMSVSLALSATSAAVIPLQSFMLTSNLASASIFTIWNGVSERKQGSDSIEKKSCQKFHQKSCQTVPRKMVLYSCQSSFWSIESGWLRQYWKGPSFLVVWAGFSAGFSAGFFFY